MGWWLRAGILSELLFPIKETVQHNGSQAMELLEPVGGDSRQRNFALVDSSGTAMRLRSILSGPFAASSRWA
jgi:hypothetical protein